MEKYDIVVRKQKPVQVVGFDSENGVYIQDIHTKITLTHRAFIDRADSDQVKWFCERTEHINFTKPKNQKIR